MILLVARRVWSCPGYAELSIARAGQVGVCNRVFIARSLWPRAGSDDIVDPWCDRIYSTDGTASTRSVKDSAVAEDYVAADVDYGVTNVRRPRSVHRTAEGLRSLA